MTVRFPINLLGQLADRRVVFVLGAGITMASSANAEGNRPPSWPMLLESVRNQITLDEDEAAFFDQCKYYAPLQAAEILQATVGRSEFHELVAKQLEGIATNELHNILEDFNPRLVLTTNFDVVLEKNLNQDDWIIQSYRGGSSVSDLVRSRKNVLLKLHGSVNDLGSMIFSESDYARMAAEHPNFIKMIEAIAMTHTFLFIGMGFNGDPDVTLMMRNAAIVASSEQPHYAIVPKTEMAKVRNALGSSMGIKFLEYDASNNHELLPEFLGELLNQVQEKFGQLAPTTG